MSIVHVKEGGEASTLPAVSVARTSNVCEPCVRPVKLFGEVQDDQPPVSKLALEGRAGLVRAEREARCGRVRGLFGCAVIVVAGAALSIVKVRETGVVWMLVAVSVARTLTV